MALIVQKFGGSSVKDCDHLFRVARIIDGTRRAGNDVVAVVSAQGDTTDDLLEKVAEITPEPVKRELDMLLSTGEQSTIALLTMALHSVGCPAVSLTGWQAGFHTDREYTKARITRLDTERLTKELEEHKVVVVAGFQGLNEQGDITTLGRGGSDTSAVAIAAALHAEHCQIYTDVEGVYTADPRKVPHACKLQEISVDEMLELSAMGSQVLNNRSVELAKKYRVELEVRSSMNPAAGTMVTNAENAMEDPQIKGVTKEMPIALIAIRNLTDTPDVCCKIFHLLAQNKIMVDTILQSPQQRGRVDLYFSVSAADQMMTVSLLQKQVSAYGESCEVQADSPCAKVSVVGTGLQTHSDIAENIFAALVQREIEIKMITTGEVKASILVSQQDADLALRAIHDALIKK